MGVDILRRQLFDFQSENESLNNIDDKDDDDNINDDKDINRDMVIDDYGRDGSGTYRGSNSSLKTRSSGSDTNRSQPKYDVVDSLDESNNLSRYNVNGNVDIMNPVKSLKKDDEHEKMLDRENEEYLKKQMYYNSDEDEFDNPRSRKNANRGQADDNGLVEYSDDNDSLNKFEEKANGVNEFEDVENDADVVKEDEV